MKTIHPYGVLCIALALAGKTLVAQTPPGGATPYVITQRGDHHRVWSRTVSVTNAVGQVSVRTNSYQELETGMHVRQPDGTLADASTEIEITPEGAAARRTRHQVLFAANCNVPVALDLLTADGRRFQSRVVGLALLDYSSGQSVLIAELKDSIGQLLPSLTEVVYPDAFAGGVQADLTYQNYKSGLEQNIVLRSQLPAPSRYGLNANSTILQVLTEFVTAPQPQREQTVDGAGRRVDAVLGFGEYKIGKGRGFAVGAADGESIPVNKYWADVGGLTILFEEVPYQRIEPLLRSLPRLAGVSPSPDGVLHRVSKERLLPPPPAVQPVTQTIQLAKADFTQSPGYVLDYSILSSTNTLLKTDMTYLVTGSVSINNLIVEGGTVVKFTNSTAAKLTVTGTIDCQTGPYRPAVFTSYLDGSAGESIASGTITNYHGNGLQLSTSGGVLHDLRFRHTASAVKLLFNVGTVSLANVQFVQCQYGVDSTSQDDNEITVDNALFHDLTNVLKGGHDPIFRGRQLTVDRCDKFGNPAGLNSGELYLTNSLLVNLTNGWGNFDLKKTNSVSTGTAGDFQTVGAGGHYLADNTYRNTGTTNLPTSLLADLKQKTTYSPILITTNLTANTTLQPQAQRDTDLPDRGYHYDPIDFMVASVTLTNATLTLTNGVVLGTSPGTNPNSGILWLRSNGKLISEGTPTQFNRVVRYHTVQEQTVTSNVNNGILVYLDSGSTTPEIRCRFSAWSALSGGGDHLRAYNVHYPFSFIDCQFTASQFYLKGCPVGLTNCLFERVVVDLKDDGDTVDRFLYNNLLRGGTLTLVRSGSGAAHVRDTLFDQTTTDQTGTITHDHNAYVTNYSRLTPNGSGDVIVTNTPVYQTHWLGNYYYPTNDGKLSKLLNAGSRTAANAGLYHFTTTTNQVKETNSTVDIGFHYVAVNSSGVPIDTDLDGLADYLADKNGNGTVDAGETDWGVDSDGDGLPDSWELRYFGTLSQNGSGNFDADGWSNLQEYQAASNPANNMVVAWGSNTNSLSVQVGQSTVPYGLTEVAAVAGGLAHTLVLKSNGTVVAWGDNNSQQTNVPAGLSNLVGIAASANNNAVLRADGTVVAWGDNSYNQTNVPGNVTNIVALASGTAHYLALRSNGIPVAWGSNADGRTNVPAGVTGVKTIAAGYGHNVVLLTNGIVKAWGNNEYGQTNVPPTLSNVVAVAAGGYHSLALKSNGTVVAWGNNTNGENNVPLTLSNVVAIAGGGCHSLALRSDGTVVAWGLNASQQTNVPAGLNGVVAIDAGDRHSLVIRTGLLVPVVSAPPASQTNAAGSTVTFSVNIASPLLPAYQWQFKGSDIPGATNSSLVITLMEASYVGDYTLRVSNNAGTTTSQPATLTQSTPTQAQTGSVVAWGRNDYKEGAVPFGLTNIMSIAGGLRHTVALTGEGTVIGWGTNDFGQLSMPGGLTNLQAIAAGDYHNLALKSDGTVVAWGRNTFGQTNVPNGLTNVVAIAAGGNQSLALRSNGSITNWGTNFATMPAGLTNIMAIAAGTNFCVALRSNGIVVAWGNNANNRTNVPSGLSNVVAIAAGGAQTLALRSNGSVTNWGATAGSIPSNLTNAMGVAAGYAHSLALKNDGTVVTWGNNTYGETNVVGGLAMVKSIAAGGYHSLAATFSPFIQYPIDVSKDVLLIYNTNSADSKVVKDYYLSNRPMVGNANVLGIACPTSYGCPTNETALRSEYTNQIQTPVLNWLKTNPTKYPQYVILFLDIPARVNDFNQIDTNGFRYYGGSYAHASVSVQLRDAFPGWKPFITHLNMNGTNDCKAYIDKLAGFGATNSPGKLVISASAGTNYANTNYVVDNVRHAAYAPDIVVRLATNGLAAAGVSVNSIQYADQVEPCIQFETNVVNGVTNIICVDWLTLSHLTNAVNVAGYISWGFHSQLGANYAIGGDVPVKWTGNSSWYIIQTGESFNGRRFSDSGNFMQWFRTDAFGGTNYSNTPVGVVTHVDEPFLNGISDSRKYFGLWAGGKDFAISAWNSRLTDKFQAVGDPFVKR